MNISSNTLFPSAGTSGPSPSFRLPASTFRTTQDILNSEVYLQRNHPGNVELFKVDGVGLVGMMMTFADEGPVFLPGIQPNYLKRFYENPEYQPAERAVWAKTSLKSGILPGAYLFYHPNCNVFGHFLLEALPKLFAVRKEMASLGLKRLLIHDSAPSFMQDLARLVLPEVSFQVLKSSEAYVGRVISSSIENSYRLHPEIMDRMMAFAAAYRKDDSPRKIFVSRSRLRRQSYRTWENADEVEAQMADRGFTVVHPETLDLKDQISLFAGAETIVGEYGSAMHWALFCRPDARIVCINWINNVQQAIALGFGHRLSFVLPEGRGGVTAEEAGQGPSISFRIDPTELWEHLSVR